MWDTLETKIAVLELDPGVLYTVTVTAWGCGHQGHPLRLPVRTGETHVITAKDRKLHVGLFKVLVCGA